MHFVKYDNDTQNASRVTMLV